MWYEDIVGYKDIIEPSIYDMQDAYIPLFREDSNAGRDALDRCLRFTRDSESQFRAEWCRVRWDRSRGYIDTCFYWDKGRYKDWHGVCEQDPTSVRLCFLKSRLSTVLSPLGRQPKYIRQSIDDRWSAEVDAYLLIADQLEERGSELAGSLRQLVAKSLKAERRPYVDMRWNSQDLVASAHSEPLTLETPLPLETLESSLQHRQGWTVK